MGDFEHDPVIGVNPLLSERKSLDGRKTRALEETPPNYEYDTDMSMDELYDICDTKFGNWIAADQEGEIVIYTGLKFKGDRVVPRYELGNSKIYGGRNNNMKVGESVSRVRTPRKKD